jgi:hypothetical protein
VRAINYPVGETKATKGDKRKQKGETKATKKGHRRKHKGETKPKKGHKPVSLEPVLPLDFISPPQDCSRDFLLFCSCCLFFLFDVCFRNFLLFVFQLLVELQRRLSLPGVGLGHLVRLVPLDRCRHLSNVQSISVVVCIRVQ